MRALLSSFLAACLLAPLVTTLAADRPNVVVILSDDFGYGSAGCYGADPKLVRTPHIDRLAREGRRFTNGYTTSSVCSPTRYSLLTGRYCWRTDLKSGVLSTLAALHIEPARLNMASLLKRLGYATAAIGKWHLGYGTGDGSPRWRVDFTGELTPGPLDIGFDYHFSVPGNHGDITGAYVENRFIYGLRTGKIPPGAKIGAPAADDPHFKADYTKADTESGRAEILALDAPRRVNESVMPLLTRKAAHWIEAQPAGTPFFLYYTPVAVHNPVTPDKDIAGQSAAGSYGDWIHELDRSVGGVLEALDRKGFAENTLVIFTSDNGGVFRPTRADIPQTKAFEAGLKVNGPLKGSKHDVWEGGFRVPFLARWPGKVPAGSTSDDVVSVVDLLATVGAVVGEPLPPAATGAEDSVSFMPDLLGKDSPQARDHVIVHSSDGVFAIRKGAWKYIEGVPADETSKAARNAHRDQFKPQLYDLAQDPAETSDVSARHPDVVKELSALLVRYREGGYSRELPPVVEKKKTATVELPPPAGEIVVKESLAQPPAKPWTLVRGAWTPHDGGMRGAEKNSDSQGAQLRGPIGIADGEVRYQIRFDGANRHSLRIETEGKQSSFRVEISRAYVGLTKNPEVGEDKSKTLPLARKNLKLEAGVWYPVRITFTGEAATVQVADQTITGRHPILAKPKPAGNFLVFGESATFRNVVVAKP